MCTKGIWLLLEYQGAERERGAARQRLLLRGVEPKLVGGKILSREERRYSQAFVAWVTHRGFCIGCRANIAREDPTQVAPVRLEL